MRYDNEEEAKELLSSLRSEIYTDLMAHIVEKGYIKDSAEIIACFMATHMITEAVEQLLIDLECDPQNIADLRERSIERGRKLVCDVKNKAYISKKGLA